MNISTSLRHIHIIIPNLQLQLCYREKTWTAFGYVGLYPFFSIQTTSLQQIYRLQKLKYLPVCYLKEKLI